MKKLLVLFILAALPACGAGKSAKESSVKSPSVTISITGDSDTPVAEINGNPVTEKELNEVIAAPLTRLQSQLFDIQLQGINALIDNRLVEAEAKKENVSVQELLKKNVEDKVGTVNEQEVKDFFEKNKERFGGKSFEEIKKPLQQQLFTQKASVYRDNYLDRLREAANIKIFLTRPTVDVSVDDDPSRGPDNAPVTIIEFTDYQCPFCGRARPTVYQILDTYGDKVHYVVRDFPLSFHPYAKKAAEAAGCAGEQGKYWEYSKILWENQRALDVPDLKKYAKNLNLNTAKFDTCLDTDQFSEEIEKDIADGIKAGVSGTPTFFINGQLISGARPFEDFKEIIDSALVEQKGKS